MVICIILAFAVFFLGCAQEETMGTVQGTVTLENATEHIGVKINLTGTGFTATTQRDGSFQISNVPAGSYKIAVEKEGYISVEQEIEIRVGEVTKVEFVLLSEIPVPPSLPNP